MPYDARRAAALQGSRLYRCCGRPSDQGAVRVRGKNLDGLVGRMVVRARGTAVIQGKLTTASRNMPCCQGASLRRVGETAACCQGSRGKTTTPAPVRQGWPIIRCIGKLRDQGNSALRTAPTAGRHGAVTARVAWVRWDQGSWGAVGATGVAVCQGAELYLDTLIESTNAVTSTIGLPRSMAMLRGACSSAAPNIRCHVGPDWGAALNLSWTLISESLRRCEPDYRRLSSAD